MYAGDESSYGSIVDDLRWNLIMDWELVKKLAEYTSLTSRCNSLTGIVSLDTRKQTVLLSRNAFFTLHH